MLPSPAGEIPPSSAVRAGAYGGLECDVLPSPAGKIPPGSAVYFAILYRVFCIHLNIIWLLMRHILAYDYFMIHQKMQCVRRGLVSYFV